MNDYANSIRFVNQTALMSLSLAYMPVRMENCTLMAASYGMDYIWPLLDPRLIQQWFSTPTLWKVGDGRVFRYLHRKAIADVCPDQIVNKIPKSMGGQEIMQHFELKSNRHHFQQLLDMAEEIPATLGEIIDVNVLRAIARNGLAYETVGYEVFSALIMLNWNLQALVSWRKH
jgi:asparagine synthase (glutamine-hydrolysing)